VTFELVADCRSNEIGTVRVEPFLHHEKPDLGPTAR